MKNAWSAPSILLALVLLLSPALALADMTFKAADGQPIHAKLSKASPGGRAIALLFHQARGNRHEYDSIVPRLNRMGFDTLAVDQRSGGAMFGHENRTVQQRGSSASYLAAYPDLQGALEWAHAHDYQTIVAVGSSYSSSLVMRLAAQDGKALDAVAAFSPGEYFDNPDMVKHAVAQIRIPLYITTDPDEEDNVDDVLQDAHSSKITRYKPEHGVHGASTLDPERDPGGYKANWQSFRKFMARFAPSGS